MRYEKHFWQTSENVKWNFLIKMKRFRVAEVKCFISLQHSSHNLVSHASHIERHFLILWFLSSTLLLLITEKLLWNFSALKLFSSSPSHLHPPSSLRVVLSENIFSVFWFSFVLVVGRCSWYFFEFFISRDLNSKNFSAEILTRGANFSHELAN